MTGRRGQGPRLDTVPGTGPLLAARRFFTQAEVSADGRSLHESDPAEWDRFYRDRWAHDKVVRSTHGVNCTGSCSWQVFVKDGLITWEHQATDYPSAGPDSPEYEPRGCPRGASFSWYTYSPSRVRYPYVRGVLLQMWREARARLGDPVAAWAEITGDPGRRRAYQRARGKGGYADNVKFADDWLAPHPDTDGALAMGHVILTEFFRDRPVAYFTDYVRRFTDLPFLVTLERRGDAWRPGRFLTAADLGDTSEHAEFKPAVLDEVTGSARIPNGSLGFRWGEAGAGRWNLDLGDITPLLSLAGRAGGQETVTLPRFDEGPTEGGSVMRRGVPATQVGGHLVTTVFDLLLAQYGVRRDGHPGDWPASYQDASQPYTPAWAAEITSVPAQTIARIAREFARNAERTRGRSMIAMGAGTNHWFHSDQIYRAFLSLVLLTGCQGVNGGGWAHYVGQEKVRPLTGFQHLAFAFDWQRPTRHMAGTPFWYLATDQWRYEGFRADELASPLGSGAFAGRAFADCNAQAVRLGWMPSHPAFNRNPLDLADEATAAGVPAAEHEGRRITFADTQTRPQPVITSPEWSGSETGGRRYSAFVINVERSKPWHTLTGRQHFFLDHDWIAELGEQLPAYRPPLNMQRHFGDQAADAGAAEVSVRYLTPHSKWSIHSEYADNAHMLALSRGGPVIWMSVENAARIGAADNDWVEAYNRNGVIAARAVVSHRMPPGTVYMYHAQDRNVNVPRTEISGRRGGTHNSLTRLLLKPSHLIGGYAQFTYGFNYYGPTGNQRDEMTVVRRRSQEVTY